MTRQEKLDKVYQVNGDWISIMIGDAEERAEAWEEYVDGVEAMSDEELQAEYAKALELEASMQ